MSTPTEHPLPDRFDGPLPLRLWLRPVEPMLPVLCETQDKPIGQFTMKELLAWAATLGYFTCSLMLAEKLAFNLLHVAVRGR
jgi:hypothetical protein